jgi:hypothetical protein
MKYNEVLLVSATSACLTVFIWARDWPTACCFGLCLLVFASAQNWFESRSELSVDIARLQNVISTLAAADEARSGQLTELTDEISKINDRLGPMQIAMNVRNR